MLELQENQAQRIPARFNAGKSAQNEQEAQVLNVVYDIDSKYTAQNG